jgi:hypothetical protein
MGEVIHIAEYLERKTAPTAEDLRKRIANIAIEQVLLGSEKARLQAQLEAMQQG